MEAQKFAILSKKKSKLNYDLHWSASEKKNTLASSISVLQK